MIRETGPYLPNVQHDIFLSYKHVADPDPWIDALYVVLHDELRPHLDRLDIWRDVHALRAGDTWHAEIDKAVASAAIFLAVVTDTYLHSEVCVRELDLYLKRTKAARDDGVSRVICPVLRHDFDVRRPPGYLKDYEAVRFFDPDTKHEFRTDDPAGRFYLAVAELAQELKLQLQGLAGVIRNRMTPVFLASMGYGDDERRKALRRELLQRDVLLLPESPYAWSLDGIEDLIVDDIDRAALCIHVVPRDADAERSAQVRLQLERATSIMKAKGKPMPLIWIPARPPLGATPDPLIDFIEHDLAQAGVEYYEGDSIEPFKTMIHDALAKCRARTVVRADAVPAKIALIVPADDVRASGALMALLGTRLERDAARIQVSADTPLASRTAILDGCASAVVVWGHADESWVQDTLADPSLARFRSRGALCLHLCDPRSDAKDTFFARGVSLLRADDPNFETKVRDFVVATEAGA